MTAPMVAVVRDLGVRVEVLRDRGSQVERSHGRSWEHHAYELRVHLDRLPGAPSYDTTWTQGYGIETVPQDEPGSVFAALLLDASYGDQTFREFCDELGYDHGNGNPADHHDTWEACRKVHDWLTAHVPADQLDAARLAAQEV